MRTKRIPSSWISRDGWRLDCNPYMSGALEARLRLTELSCLKEKLKDLCEGGISGLVNAGRITRQWVDDPAHGVPFLSSTTILRGDLSNLSFISNRAVLENPKLLLREGYTLITRAGSVGRMSYARSDMDGMACTEDVLRVIPDQEKIAPGYLYAFLSSRFGVPLITSGTYGAIIQHIEPEHIADLPVPRLGREVEARVHNEIQKASTGLTNYTRLLNEATNRLISELGLREPRRTEWMKDVKIKGWSEARLDQESLRALNYDPRASEYRSRIKEREYSELGSLCDPRHFKGKTIFKRIDSSQEFGVMLVGQRQAFQVRPEGRCISRKSIEGLGLQVPVGTTLIPSHGTLGENELYCRALMVTQYTSRYAFSGDFFRCIPDPGLINPGYLFAFLRSRIAFRMLRSISCGGKQQEQNIHMMRRFPIPRLGKQEEEAIGSLVDEACCSYDQAIFAEARARLTVESTIEGCP
jgi:hypothetical protein